MDGHLPPLPITRGKYSLELWSGEQKWFFESVTVDGPPTPVVIRLSSVRVDGTVTVGGQPLPGQIIFGGERGPVSIPFDTDQEGHFQGTLPNAGIWAVTVQSSELSVQRTLARVPVERNEIGETHLTIDLPDTTLKLQVKDETGANIHAFVKVIPSGPQDRIFQVRAEPEKQFVLRGLEEGEITLEAEAPGRRRSRLERVQIARGKENEATLIVRPESIIEGQLVSMAGGPVAGGKLLAFEDGRVDIGSSLHTSDTTGAFRLHVRPDTRDVTLVYWADGLALGFRRVMVADTAVRLMLAPIGGVVVVDFGRDVDLADPTIPSHVMVGSGGSFLPIAFLRSLAFRRGVLTNAPASAVVRDVTLPQMNPGSYAACIESLTNVYDGRHAAVQCEQGTLAAGSEVRLILPEAKWPNGSSAQGPR
jgi:hypothetical protein